MPAYRVSNAALNVASPSPVLNDLLKSLMQNSARVAIAAVSPGAITDNSTGVGAASIVGVATGGLTKTGVSGTNLAPRAAFNTAIGKVNNALNVLATYLNTNVATPLFLTLITLNGGTVATPGTVPALDKALAATTGAGTAASATLTGDGTNITNGDTVTIGGKVYTFQDTLTNVDGNVKKGASAAASLTNLFNAINGTGGTPGTDYATATVANGHVTATNPTGTTVVVTAKLPGAAGNSIAVLATSTHLDDWSSATLAGGADGNAILRSEALSVLTVARNNLATVLRRYNDAAVALGIATLADSSGGSASQSYTLVTQTTATTAVDNASASGDYASDVQIDAALDALANNIATIAAKIGTPLFASNAVKIVHVLTP